MRKSVRFIVGLSLLGSMACSGPESGNEGSGAEAAPEVARAEASGLLEPWVDWYNAGGSSPVIEPRSHGYDYRHECGYCWGPSPDVQFVDQYALGPHGERCVRQIPCRGGTYGFNDGFMEQRPLVPGSYYYYRPYAFNESGLGYGAVGQFYWTGPSKPANVSDVRTWWMWFAHMDMPQCEAFQGHAILSGYVNDPDRMSECGVCWGSAPDPHLVDQSTNEPGRSVRCMRSPGCVTNVHRAAGTRWADIWYSTTDGYQAPIDYVPGAVYNYVAYGIIDGAVRYGETRQFTAPPRVTTGGVQWSAFGKTLLAGSVESQGPIKECGICWGSNRPRFVDSADNGPQGDYCMRQIGCGGRSYAYWTDDGFMRKRDYENGWNYEYVAYAIAGNGEIYYGDYKTFAAVR